MEYSDDNIARIRAALLDYHGATHSNGRKRSWSVAAEAIAAAETPDLVPPEDDDDDDDLAGDDQRVRDPYKPLAEALRRFAAGTQTPSTDRLDAITDFLKSKKFLSDADLRSTERSPDLVQALSAFFGAAHDPAQEGIEGRFTASRKRDGLPNELSILTVRKNGNRAPAVEDRFYSLPIAPQSTKREALVRLLGRTGGSEQCFDGWVLLNKGRINLFLQDTLRSEVGVYTVVTGPGASMALLKSNDFGFPPIGYARLRKLAESKPPVEAALEKLKERLWVYRREDGDDGR